MKAFIIAIGLVMAIVLCSHEPSANAQDKKHPFVWGFIHYAYDCNLDNGKVVSHILMSQPFNYCMSETSDDDLLNMALPIIKEAAERECSTRTNSDARIDGQHGTEAIAANLIKFYSTQEINVGRVVSSFFWQPVNYSEKCQ
jgi:hypothetical protein